MEIQEFSELHTVSLKRNRLALGKTRQKWVETFLEMAQKSQTSSNGDVDFSYRKDENIVLVLYSHDSDVLSKPSLCEDFHQEVIFVSQPEKYR